MTSERLLLIDHYDSFTYTIKAYFETLGARTEVVQYDDPRLLHLEQFAPTALVFSPGPGHPTEASSTVALIKKHYTYYPMLGVCLGMQCMAHAFDGKVIHAPEVMHGKQSLIDHDHTGIFQDVPQGFSATRYHSLMVDPLTLPAELRVTAWTHDASGARVIMGVAHMHYPLFGIQYHPEAVLTEHGYLLFRHFLNETRAWRTIK